MATDAAEIEGNWEPGKSYVRHDSWTSLARWKRAIFGGTLTFTFRGRQYSMPKFWFKLINLIVSLAGFTLAGLGMCKFLLSKQSSLNLTSFPLLILLLSSSSPTLASSRRKWNLRQRHLPQRWSCHFFWLQECNLSLLSPKNLYFMISTPLGMFHSGFTRR